MEERKSLITPRCGDSSLVSDISTSECGLNSILNIVLIVYCNGTERFTANFFIGLQPFLRLNKTADCHSKNKIVVLANYFITTIA